MQQERGKTRREDRVANPDVPGGPLELEPAELGKVGVRVEDAGVVEGRGGRVHGHPC